jgi:hypothetical protein
MQALHLLLPLSQWVFQTSVGIVTLLRLLIGALLRGACLAALGACVGAGVCARPCHSGGARRRALYNAASVLTGLAGDERDTVCGVSVEWRV